MRIKESSCRVSRRNDQHDLNVVLCQIDDCDTLCQADSQVAARLQRLQLIKLKVVSRAITIGCDQVQPAGMM